MNKIKKTAKTIKINPGNLKAVPSNLTKKAKKIVNGFIDLLRFFFLLQAFLLDRFFKCAGNCRFFRFLPKPIRAGFDKISQSMVGAMDRLDKAEDTTISQREIIRMSIQNMTYKKSRTAITVGGMSIGIGAIVFLVSVGYGLQNLVVSRIANLEEMKQADVMPNEQGNVFINDKTLSDFKKIDDIEHVFPLISLVGRVNFKNSVTDVVVHGVTGEYLENSALNPTEGKFFDNNQIAKQVEVSIGKVAGAKTESHQKGEVIQTVFYTVNPETWIRVRSGPGTDSPIIGYTRRVEGTQEGQEVWGGYYPSNDGSGEAATDERGESLGRWVKSEFPLWKFTGCIESNETESQDSENSEQTAEEAEEVCESGYQKIKSGDQQLWQEGYTAELGLTLRAIPGIPDPRVLGETTESLSDLATATDSTTATSSAYLQNVDEIDQEILNLLQATSSAEVQSVSKISLDEKAQKKAVINEAMAEILGEEGGSIVGSSFQISFVLLEDTLTDEEFQGKKVETEPEAYQIVGVLPGGDSPIVYVPFIDLRSLGVERFSQARVNVDKVSNLSDARGKIEALGYSTNSVADTVQQVKDLFATARWVLGALGMVALAVASLGMFNTLTVSLLERTREVGVLKSMGMKSNEVKNLFLTESMVMGFFGGIMGIAIGLAAGKLLGLALSAFAVARGIGFIDVTYLPIGFGVTVVFLSLLVGFITGHYPAKRATKISALNALRYE